MYSTETISTGNLISPKIKKFISVVFQQTKNSIIDSVYQKTLLNNKSVNQIINKIPCVYMENLFLFRLKKLRFFWHVFLVRGLFFAACLIFEVWKTNLSWFNFFSVANRIKNNSLKNLNNAFSVYNCEIVIFLCFCVRLIVLIKNGENTHLK